MAAFTTIAAVAALALTAVGTGLAISQSMKPIPKPPVRANVSPEAPPPPLPPAAPDKTIEEADKTARQKAAQRQKELERRQSGASTVLTSPLGVATPAANIKTSVLGQ